MDVDDIFARIDKNINIIEQNNSLTSKKITEPEVVKKKVGRPTTKKQTVFPQVRGIVETYDNQMVHMILHCRYIVEFKKMILICKYHKCQEVFVQFKRNYILFHIPNLDSKLNYFFKINTENTILYYCERDFSIIINLCDLESALSRINPDNDMIKFVQYKQCIGIRIEIGFERFSVKTEDVKVIDIINQNKISFVNEEIDFSGYDLTFKINAKELKSIITVIKDKTSKCRFCKNRCEDIVTLIFYIDEMQDRKIIINNDEITFSGNDSVDIDTIISCNDIRGITIHAPSDIINLYFSSKKENPIIAEYKLPIGYIRLYITSNMV